MKKVRTKHLVEAEILNTLTKIFTCIQQGNEFKDVLKKLDKLDKRYNKK